MGGIYVEILIERSVDEVWRFTQEPDVHQLWDLRFSTIEYSPRESEESPQRFRYSTRIGFGLKIAGEGESTGNREASSGARTSALKFWSDDSKSLIREGSGYWRYIPEGDATRFLTWYDYRVRFGAAGRIADRLVFRPLLGWATAWSFDRLRLWIENGLPPPHALRIFAIHALARCGIGFVWLWHGLVPKLLSVHADERSMAAAAGLPIDSIPWIGALEVAFGLVALASWRWRAFFLLTIAAMLAALTSVAVSSPEFLAAAFNPVTLNLSVIALAIVGYVASAQVPSAASCRRSPGEKTQ